MVLHNDIWGNTSVTVIEEIDSRFLIAEELNMLALYSRPASRKAVVSYEVAQLIIHGEKDKV